MSAVGVMAVMARAPACGRTSPVDAAKTTPTLRSRTAARRPAEVADVAMPWPSYTKLMALRFIGTLPSPVVRTRVFARSRCVTRTLNPVLIGSNRFIG